MSIKDARFCMPVSPRDSPWELSIKITVNEVLCHSAKCNFTGNTRRQWVDSLWSSDAIWRQRSRSGYGLVPRGTKPLPEQMMTDHQWSPVTFILGQFHVIPQPSITNIRLKTTYLQSHSNFPGANELKSQLYEMLYVAGEKQVWNLAPFTDKDFKIRGLGDRVKDLQNLTTLYPDINKSQAFSRFWSQTSGGCGLWNSLVVCQHLSKVCCIFFIHFPLTKVCSHL